ncbi:MAG: M24 family metallopeptidase [Anaerolineae bacterium]
MERICIPGEEFRERWARLQEEMARSDLDLFIAYSDDHAVFGPANARYLANFPAHFEPVCVLVPAAGEPLLLTGPESEGYARLTSEVKDIRVVQEFAHPEEDYPFTELVPLADVIAEAAERAGGKVRRVGLAGLDIMTHNVYRALREALTGVERAEAENALLRLRAIKSENEIKVIRRAYQIAQKGMEAALEAIREGATEREIAAVAEGAMRSSGAEGFGIDTIVASGPNSSPILARTSFRKVQQDELILLTVAPRYEGYHAAIGRPVVLGQPSDEVRRAMEAALEAQRASREALRPGAIGKDADGAARRVLEQAGLAGYCLYGVVHSVGVAEFEPPIFSPRSEDVAQVGMVFSIDVPLFHAPWGGLRYEDGFLITEKGAEPLEDFRTGVVTL